MLVVEYFLVAITIAVAIMCILFRRSGKSFEGMICKFMASFGFVSTAIVGYCYNPHNIMFFCLVCFALMFGWCGDVILGIKEIAPKFRGKLIPLGTVFFLIGHIFFLTAFMIKSGFSIIPLAAGIAIGIIGLILINILMKGIDSKLKVLLAVYYTLLYYKAATAIYLLVTTGETAYIFASVGSVLFVFSDTCLGLLYFTPTKKKNLLVTLELSTYYLAQTLLALSMAYIV